MGYQCRGPLRSTRPRLVDRRPKSFLVALALHRERKTGKRVPFVGERTAFRTERMGRSCDGRQVVNKFELAAYSGFFLLNTIRTMPESRLAENSVGRPPKLPPCRKRILNLSPLSS